MKLSGIVTVITIFSTTGVFAQSACQKLFNEALKDQARLSKAETQLELDRRTNFLTKEQAVELTIEKETASKGIADVKLLFDLYCSGR